MMTETSQGFEIRLMQPRDATTISEAFARIEWDKPVAQFDRYLAQQEEGERICWVASVDDVFAGYVTLRWNPDSPGLAGPAYPRSSISTFCPSSAGEESLLGYSIMRKRPPKSAREL